MITLALFQSKAPELSPEDQRLLRQWLAEEAERQMQQEPTESEE